MNVYPGTNTTVPCGTRFKIKSGTLAGLEVVVEDRIGCCSQFDIWLPTQQQADDYGRQTIDIEQL